MKKLIFLFVFLVSGCAVGPRYTPVAIPPEGKALVHFMQTWTFRGQAYPTVFSVNDIKVVSMYDKGYSWMYLSPGMYKFKTNRGLFGGLLGEDELQFTMLLEQGKEYYLEHTDELVSNNKYRIIFRNISIEDASKLIKEYRYSEIDKTISIQPIKR